MTEHREINILIADENKPFTDATKSFLNNNGYIVTVINDMEGIYSELEKGKYQIFVLDMKMPEGTGEAILRQVKEKYPQICIITTMSYPPMDASLSFIREKAYGFLQKPFEPNELSELIWKAVSENRVFFDPEEESKKAIGRRLRVLRKQHSYTLKVLSNKTGLSQSLISKIELGRTAASVATLLKLSLALEVPIKVFFE